MILPPARIVALMSREMTLQPGDVIACGTSVGALPMRPGMVVDVTIEGIGALSTPTRRSPRSSRAATPGTSIAGATLVPKVAYPAAFCSPCSTTWA